MLQRNTGKPSVISTVRPLTAFGVTRKSELSLFGEVTCSSLKAERFSMGAQQVFYRCTASFADAVFRLEQQGKAGTGERIVMESSKAVRAHGQNRRRCRHSDPARVATDFFPNFVERSDSLLFVSVLDSREKFKEGELDTISPHWGVNTRDFL